VEHNRLEASADLSALSIPAHMRAGIESRNTIEDVPALDPTAASGVYTSFGLGARHHTDMTDVGDGTAQAGVSRATRRTASLLNTIVLKRNRFRSV
jgi:hypothetical protein